MLNHISELQELLPNFPSDILEQWFLPYVESDGMPWDDHGNPKGRWNNLLNKKPLSYWQSIGWYQDTCYIPKDYYSKNVQEALEQIAAGAVFNEKNWYTFSINDLKERFDSILKYLEVHKEYPKSPILIYEKFSGFNILDGNHRVSAYLYSLSQHYMNEKNMKIDDLSKFKQKYWIGISKNNI